MISLPSSVLDLLNEGRCAVRWLIRADLDAGPEGIWNDTYPITFGGVDFFPAAFTVGSIGSRVGLSSEQVEIVLSYLSPGVAAIMDGLAWHQRPILLSRAFLNPAGEVLHVIPRFSGFMDAAPVADEADGTASMILTAESNNRELQRSTGRVRSDADQRIVNATDGFFKHTTASAIDQQIFWGRKGPQAAGKATR